MTARLSKDFTLAELCRTETGLSNVPPAEVISRLAVLAGTILQPVRDRFGAIEVTSGYRSPAVNAWIHGARNSQHLLGEAADIIPLAPGVMLLEVFLWIKDHLRFGQVILEHAGDKDWIHVSLERTDRPNQMALKYEDGKYEAWT